MSTFIQGWLLGIAYVAPIGMQNMYLINTSIEKSRSRALQVALVMIFFDITLALACFMGIGLVLEHVKILRVIVMGIGSIAVMYIGYSLIVAKPSMESNNDFEKPIMKIIVSCFMVTWLNPQAIIDGTLLLGGFRATLENTNASLFIFGVAVASTMWFLSISTLVSKFKNVFNIKILKTINVLCGSILVFFGLKLGISFIGTFF
ncbi:LysE/ArgO family amino acid transporter [Oceanirhabdus sp. W0125-5]|uniref:LysE/ArgO family amino acid transporter n=1 Tax=Oceanirhabdus sp. W0125-5 TaxID=2999116 RepID=UPI0022F2F366|nr:LysE family transporter [Oceanirhabdus sp. W0125-5]WBW94990.1 LysE family transporter [Oceanirhabdus sp. W0125-5]